MKKAAKNYGKELIIDLHDCDATKFRRSMIRKFFRELCDVIHMKRTKLTWWDDYRVPLAEQETEPHLKGTSAVQFIMTSSITIHALDLMGHVYLNIFSCSDFDRRVASEFCQKFFKGRIVKSTLLARK
jgi:S-adenosylmethionine/arginine decarboxylase-like enzyme